MPITHHTDLLNALIAKYNLKSYLEIGVQNPANNFDKIHAKYKASVDPNVDEFHDFHFKETSDKFFERVKSGFMFLKNGERYDGLDLIFIDGLHHADQVKRDFENSLRCLSDHGFIVIHDVLPENEEGTLVPRQTKVWWGDVYKFAMAMEYDDINFKTFNIDNGCMLVWKQKGYKITNNPELPMNWETYQKCGHILMNVQDEVNI